MIVHSTEGIRSCVSTQAGFTVSKSAFPLKVGHVNAWREGEDHTGTGRVFSLFLVSFCLR